MHCVLGGFHGNAGSSHALVVELPVVLVVITFFRIENLDVSADFNTQSHFLDFALDHAGAADQDWLGNFLIHNTLHGAQHIVVLSLGIGNARWLAAGQFDHWLHEQTTATHIRVEFVAVGLHILDGTGSDAAFHGSFDYRQGDFLDQTWIKRFGNQVFRAEFQYFIGVGLCYGFRRFKVNQIGDGFYAGLFHGVIDDGGAAVERAAENERKAEYVIDLIRIVGTTGGQNGIRAGGLGNFRHDLGGGVGHGENQRVGCHFLDHVDLQDTGAGQTQKQVGAVDGIVQGAILCLHRIAFFPGVHPFCTAFVDDPVAVDHSDIGFLQSHADQQVHAGNTGCSGTGHHQFDVFNLFVDNPESVVDCCG